MTPEQFLLFADPLPEPMLLVSGDGRILAGNQAVAGRLGVCVEQPRGRMLTDTVVEPSSEIAHYLRLCSRSRSLVLGAVTVRGPRGDQISCRTEGCRLPSDDGRPPTLLLRLVPRASAIGQFVALNQRIEELGQEVHRRRRAEDAARQQEQRLRVTLHSIGDAVIATDPEGCVALMNSIAEHLTGWKDDEARGQPLETVFQVVNENTRQPVENPALRALREGVVVGLANHSVLIARDGTEYPIDDTAAPIRDVQGQIIGSVLVFRDVTDRRRAEAAIRESEEKLRLLADTIPQLAWMAEPDGHVFWYNRRWYEYTGTSFADMQGWGWQAVHDPQVLPQVLKRWRHSLASGEPFDMVFPIRGADGVYRSFLTRVSPLRDDGGRILYWFGTNTDVSEMKRLEQALRDADRRKDEFLATLAHELRNPLAPIHNSLQILKMPRVDTETSRQSREVIERQVHHLVRLVDDLLDVSRVMRGKIELRKERVELVSVIARAIETAQPAIDAHAHELTISVPDESLRLQADPVRLAQVVGNLLTNSAKYTEANGQIRLTAQREGDQAVLRVRDTGIGIAPAMLPQIFELFVQVDQTSTRSQGGLGIGLTLVKSLVELHGGTVEAHSDGVGQGCEFVVRLPLLAQHRRAPDEKGTQDPKRMPARSSGHRLLIVDDNRDAANSLALLLRLQGHEVRVVHDGPSALEQVASFCPSLVFLDLGMPQMDGYEVARRMRQLPGLETVILVALTGWGQPEDRRRTRDAGFDHHLVKPPEPAAVQEVLHSLATAKR